MTTNELEEYFSHITLPREVDLNSSNHIRDVRRFVSSHLAVLKQNEDRPAFSAFYDRLLQLKEIISTDAGTL